MTNKEIDKRELFIKNVLGRIYFFLLALLGLFNFLVLLQF